MQNGRWNSPLKACCRLEKNTFEFPTSPFFAPIGELKAHTLKEQEFIFGDVVEGNDQLLGSGELHEFREQWLFVFDGSDETSGNVQIPTASDEGHESAAIP